MLTHSCVDVHEPEKVWANDPGRVLVARNGGHELTNLVLTTGQVQELVERMLKSSGRRRIGTSRPVVNAMLPEGHRLHVFREGISCGISAARRGFGGSVSHRRN